MRSIVRSGVRRVVRPVRRWLLALSCLISGHQHTLFVHLWSVAKKAGRDKDFNAVGLGKFQLISPEEWREFSKMVDTQMELVGHCNQSRVDWAEDRRISIDCDCEPIRAFLQRVCESEAFRSNITRIFGKNKWELVATQIWRNHPEKYGTSQKEINSTYYHVDNGGHINDRLLLNLFMYLSDVSRTNGPFTYYDRRQTSRVNRHFIRDVLRLGNLRSYDLVPEIERYIPPHELSLAPGEAVVIDNQACLHRAGFCTEGHRDMLQILVRG